MAIMKNTAPTGGVGCRINGAQEAMMRRLWCVLSLIVFTGLQTYSLAESDATFQNRWSGHGFLAAGGSMGETGAGFTGGGGGVEAFFWKRLAVSADVSAYRDNYYKAVGTFGHAGGQVAYHFSSREKARGAAPFLLFGVGCYFPEESADHIAAFHGGAGLTYWFQQRLGIHFELRLGDRPYGDNVVGIFRLGIAFR
jgi:hypothetical protein